MINSKDENDGHHRCQGQREKSRPSLKYFVNNYDHLHAKPQIFSIKKIVKKPKVPKPSASGKKRQRASEKQPSPKSKRTFKISKKDEKADVKDSPEYETDCDKDKKESPAPKIGGSASLPVDEFTDFLFKGSGVVRRTRELKKVSSKKHFQAVK